MSFSVDKETNPIKVYYNSACPVCKAGIENQKSRMKGCPVEWKDVHSHPVLVTEIHSELEQVRERLHVVDEQGQTYIGFDAFLTIWRHSPGEKWKAILLGLPLIRQLGRIAYNQFAALLYKWNKAKKHW
ncbi:Predicted thiol-disulfide oxidoreductase YuxK, DCC family [Nitrosomonas sp. Nm34]|nr:Predicted thiol-disulfide oxidoreductase YuxK, DCC family [Nitrosomonas sp. Nm34]